MKIDAITYDASKEYRLENTVVIVIDVLRCTSAIIHALSAGATMVKPVREAAEAMIIASSIGREKCILGGERNCLKVDGFDLGNSPIEYNSNNVKEKTVVISTTNGTNAICAFENNEYVYIAAMCNRTAVASAAAAYGRDILIVCSGTDGEPSADDLCAAGAVIDAITAEDIEFSDSALICRHIFRSWRDGSFDLLKTRHCSRLVKLGFMDDLDYCLSVDSETIAPRLIGDRILL